MASHGSQDVDLEEGSGSSGSESEGEAGDWLSQCRRQLQTRWGKCRQQPSWSCALQNVQEFALGLWVLALLGVAFFIVSSASADHLLQLESLLLAICASGAVYFIGTDPCFLDSLRKSVGQFRQENGQLERSNELLSSKLRDLGSVADGLQQVERQLGKDANAAEELLHDLERDATLHAVSSAINLFLSSDADRSGSLSGSEIEVFLLGFAQLWDLVPDFPPERLAGAAERGSSMDMERLSKLLGAVLAEDAAACRSQLEDICGPVVGGTVTVSDHITFGEVRIAPQGGLCADESGSDSDAGKDGELAPWFAIGPLRVWGLVHLIALIVMALGAFFCVRALLALDTLDVINCFGLLLLGGGLSLNGQLSVIAYALKEEVDRLARANEKLSESIEDLSVQVSRLSKMKKGLEKLQARFGGNASRAKALVKRQAASSTMHFVSVALQLFSRADSDQSGRLEGDELETFLTSLEAACKNLDGFDPSAVRAQANRDGLSMTDVQKLVDLIVQKEAG